MSIEDETPANTLHGDLFAVIPEWILYSDVGPNAVRLYAVLQRHIGANKFAWPSRSYLAEKMHCAIATVDGAVKELIKIGALTKKNRSNEAGHRTSSAYYLHGKSHATLANQKLDATDDQNLASGGSKTSQEREPSIESQSTSSKIFDDEVISLSTLLADLIEENGSKRPTVSDKWKTDIRLLRDKDGRSGHQIENMIRWCQNDSFWRQNILSALKLRAKYDQMRLRALVEEPTKHDGPASPTSKEDDWGDELERRRRESAPPPKDFAASVRARMHS